MLYLLIISLDVIAVAFILWLASGVDFFALLGYTTLATLLVVCIDGITAAIARFLPKKCANHQAKIYAVSGKEKKFYEKMGIRKWKDKLPEIGHFTGFRKNKIADPKNAKYVERFLMEICYGEIGHFFSCFSGFLLLLFWFIFPPLWWIISLCVAVINAALNIPFVFILRYNSYKLNALYKSLLKKQGSEEEQKQEENIDV